MNWGEGRRTHRAKFRENVNCETKGETILKLNSDFIFFSKVKDESIN